MSIVIICPFLAIWVLWVVRWHAIMLELILIHKGGLPMLLELVLWVVMMPLILIMMMLLLKLGWFVSMMLVSHFWRRLWGIILILNKLVFLVPMLKVPLEVPGAAAHR
jgi:hypothetical protein